MMSGLLLSVGVALVAVTAAALAAPVSLDEILSNPDRFRGQPVTVSGTISNFREHVTRKGRTPFYTFDFGNGTRTVLVISFEKPQCRAGAATVEGIFDQVKWRRRVNYSYEEITALNVICFRGDGSKTERTPSGGGNRSAEEDER
jgi:hypothetical protein